MVVVGWILEEGKSLGSCDTHVSAGEVLGGSRIIIDKGRGMRLGIPPGLWKEHGRNAQSTPTRRWWWSEGGGGKRKIERRRRLAG